MAVQVASPPPPAPPPASPSSAPPLGISSSSRTQTRRERFSSSTDHHLVAGTIAGCVTTAALYPLDLVKTRYQVFEHGPTPYGSLRGAFREIVAKEGWRALYQGLGPSLIGNGVSWGGYFFFYEKCKTFMRGGLGSDKSDSEMGASGSGSDAKSSPRLGSLHHLGAGIMAGTVMVCLTNPIWLIKTRLQLQNKAIDAATAGGESTGVGGGGAAVIGHRQKPYSSFVNALVTILREEGPLALYKGVGPALFLTSQGALQFTVYEWLKTRPWGNRLADILPPTTTEQEQQHQTPRAMAAYESLAMGGASKIFASLVTYPCQVVKSRLQQRFTAAGLAAGQQQYHSMGQCVRVMWQREGMRGFFKGCAPYALRAAPASAVTFVVYEETMKLQRAVVG